MAKIKIKPGRDVDGSVGDDDLKKAVKEATEAGRWREGDVDVEAFSREVE